MKIAAGAAHMKPVGGGEGRHRASQSSRPSEEAMNRALWYVEKDGATPVEAKVVRTHGQQDDWTPAMVDLVLADNTHRTSVEVRDEMTGSGSYAFKGEYNGALPDLHKVEEGIGNSKRVPGQDDKPAEDA